MAAGREREMRRARARLREKLAAIDRRHVQCLADDDGRFCRGRHRRTTICTAGLRELRVTRSGRASTCPLVVRRMEGVGNASSAITHRRLATRAAQQATRVESGGEGARDSGGSSFLPVGTTINVRLNQSLGTTSSHEGDQFTATVVDP